ncbi:MAG: ABC transporter ATP-binding protein [Candidatus Rokuibacteriota bacterium]
MPDARRRRLEIRDVVHVYEGKMATRALDGVSLDVFENEFLAIVGPVGSGKTTLVRIVAGFLTPSRGLVRWDGAPVTGPSSERGYVFQEEAIFPWMTVRDNLQFGLLAQGVPASEREKIVAELVTLIGLEGYERAYPKELSGGMSKMVEVARVLATDPAILLLDEPFGLLDAQTRSKMQDQLSRLWEEKRKTVILVTHDVEEAIYLADRVVVFTPRPGRVQAEVVVDLPRPRSLETRFSPAFLELKRSIWKEIGRA